MESTVLDAVQIEQIFDGLGSKTLEEFLRAFTVADTETNFRIPADGTKFVLVDSEGTIFPAIRVAMLGVSCSFALLICIKDKPSSLEGAKTYLQSGDIKLVFEGPLCYRK